MSFVVVPFEVPVVVIKHRWGGVALGVSPGTIWEVFCDCLIFTSDAADE